MVTDKELVGRAKIALPVCIILAVFFIFLVGISFGFGIAVITLGIGLLCFIAGVALGVQTMYHTSPSNQANI